MGDSLQPVKEDSKPVPLSMGLLHPCQVTVGHFCQWEACVCHPRRWRFGPTVRDSATGSPWFIRQILCLLEQRRNESEEEPAVSLACLR